MISRSAATLAQSSRIFPETDLSFTSSSGLGTSFKAALNDYLFEN